MVIYTFIAVQNIAAIILTPNVYFLLKRSRTLPPAPPLTPSAVGRRLASLVWSSRAPFCRALTLWRMSWRFRSPMTPWRRFSSLPALLRPFFRCRGSKSIFCGLIHCSESLQKKNSLLATGGGECGGVGGGLEIIQRSCAMLQKPDGSYSSWYKLEKQQLK